MGGRQAAIVADAGALHMGLGVGGLHLTGIVRLRRLAVVSLHRMLLCIAHRSMVHAGRTNRIGSGTAGLGLGTGNGYSGQAEDELQ